MSTTVNMLDNVFYLQRIEKALLDLGIPLDYAIRRNLAPYLEASGLVTIDETQPTQQLAPEAANRWRQLKKAAAEDRIELVLVSGFRSFDCQRKIIEIKLRKGQKLASVLAVMAAPGFSQHHTGLALDLGTLGHVDPREDFEETDAFRWLSARAKEFGFYMPYPRGNPFGFTFEPWHWALVELTGGSGGPALE